MGLIETTGALGYFCTGTAIPANVGTLCCASDVFCRSTGLFGRAKTSSARNRPIEQKARPAKKRGLKKADLETNFLFIRRIQAWLYRDPPYRGRRKRQSMQIFGRRPLFLPRNVALDFSRSPDENDTIHKFTEAITSNSTGVLLVAYVSGSSFSAAGWRLCQRQYGRRG